MAQAREHDDAALVALAQAGDWDALGRLAERHYGRIYAVTMAITRDHDDAEDATGDALERAVRSIARFRPDGAPDALGRWLRQLARRSAIDLVRARARRRARFVPLSPALPALDDPEAAAMRRETAMAVAATMALVPERQRAALCMAVLGDESMATISRAMGVGESNVRMLICRARDAFATSWREAGLPAPAVRRDSWSPAEIGKLRAWDADGVARDEMARRLGRSRHSVAAQLRVVSNPSPALARVPEAIRAEARLLHASGMSMAAIGRRLSVSQKTVARALRAAVELTGGWDGLGGAA